MIKAKLYLAYNNDGDVVGEMSRADAIHRIKRFGSNEPFRVIEINLTLPEIADPTVTLEVPADDEEAAEVKVA